MTSVNDIDINDKTSTFAAGNNIEMYCTFAVTKINIGVNQHNYRYSLANPIV